ncbi:benzoate transport [Pseudomonas cuatrocienegasensis]|uniref:Benzoate transport n=1 Tax=Pseudomonas cuatrocienegasensis TaxID=543360 RepID=A0ABY1B4M1_9PSED|nr:MULTISPECIES: MFS transporter [Pseudomonas]OEC37256.1 MFS transporter [Pseudomonas sp. 21C1]SEP90678.1 benzoate transport [Pseudomonas cuatrocienegasensis]
MNNQLRHAVDAGSMTPFQWTAIGICIVLNMIDGFDVLVMAFTAASVSAEWGLNGSQIGMLLSAGLFGMAGGSLFIAPWADRVGRRPLILGCLALSGVSMILSAYSQSPTQLGLLRMITGLGIGGILASSNVIASEYSNTRWRGLAVSLQSTGYALGATLGGMIAIYLLGQFGWRAVFLFGGLATLIAIPLTIVYLPESIDYLIARRPADALSRLNKLALRLGQAPLSAIPVGSASPANAAGTFKRLFAPDLRNSTLLLWMAFFLVMFGFYFVMSWTPKLLVSAGLSAEQGVTGGVLLSVGGIFGSTLLGLGSARFKLHHILALFMVVTAVLLALFVGTTSNLTAAFVIGALIGLFANGCVAGLYASSPLIYDASVRATGVGWGIGIGRIGAIISPLVAGHLIDANWHPSQLYIAYGMVFLAAACIVMLFRLPASRPTAEFA